MRALFGVRHGIVRHLFRADTCWRRGSKEDLLPRQVIYRHRDFAMVECVKTDGTTCILKVTNSILACMSTSASSQLYTWKIGGCLQMGVVKSVDNQNLPDPFLMRDHPNILPGCTDPSYQPLPEFFEPWAQDYARSESVTGFGLIQEDTALWEPWCWRFAHLQSTNPQLTSACQERSDQDATRLTVAGNTITVEPTGQTLENSTTPPTCQIDSDATLTPFRDVEGGQASTQDDPLLMLEPWAYTCVHHDATGSSLRHFDEDQLFEPWSAHFVPSEMRTKRRDPPQSQSGSYSVTPERQPTFLHRVSTWFTDIVTSISTESCSGKFNFGFTQSTVNTNSCWHDVLGQYQSRRTRFEPSRHFGVERWKQHLSPHFTDSATAFLSETPFHPPPDMPFSNIRVSSIQEHHFGPPVHVDRHEVIHQANRIDIPTKFTFTSIPLCWTAFQASCIVRLTTVRDAIIPPCLPLFQSKCPSCVNRHEIVSSHVTTNFQASTTPEIRIFDNLRLASTDLLGQSRLTSVSWHTGFCHKNDHDRFIPGPLHQTIRSGTVPDFTTSDNQETEVQETTPYRGISLHLEKNSAPMCQQRSILVDTDRSSLKQNLRLPQHITTCSGAVPSTNHHAVFRLSREDVVFSDGVCDRINGAATAAQDLIRILMPLRSALFEPFDSLPAQLAFESYSQQGVQQKADDCMLFSHFISEEDHRPQHFTTWSGAVPIYNNSISDGTRLPIHDCDYQLLGPRQSQNANLARVILQYQDAAQLPCHQWSSIGTHETASHAERLFLDFPDYLSDCQICTLTLDGGHQAQDHIPLRGFCVYPYVPRHQNNDVVLSAPLQGLFDPNLFTMPDLPILQPLENTSAIFHQRDLQIDATDSQHVGERFLLFDLKSIAPCLLHNTTVSRSILVDTDRSSLKQNLQLPQHITTCSGAVPSTNHHVVFRLSREDVVFSDGVCDRINCAATAAQDLIRILMPLRSALFEPFDSLPAQLAFESYSQQGVQQKADEFMLSSHFVSEEDHRLQHFTIWSGAVPIYNNSISDGTRLLIQDCDYQLLRPRQSQNANIARVILQYQDAAQLPCHQWSSIGTHETASHAERLFFDFPDYLSDCQICTLTLDGGHQAQDHIPLRGFCVYPYVPRHQNNDVVLSAPLQGLLVPNLFTMPDLPILQPLENTSAIFHQRDLQIDATDSQHVGERVLLFDLKSIAPRPLHNTTVSGAVPDPTSVIQLCFRAQRPGLLQFTTFSGAVPVNVNELHDRLQARHLQGWSHAIYRGGHPAWGKCQIVHMAPNPPFDERCAAAMQDEGWLASDEALWFLRKLQEWRSDVVIGPMVQWSPSRDLHHIMDAENQLQYTNNRLNLQIFLVDAHWCAVEIDRRTDPAHVVLIQWPPTLQTTAVLEISRIMQISPSRLLITVNDDNEVMTMCGWTILWRWYKNFAMETCLQPMIYATPQHQEQLNRVILRSQQSWNRTNATSELCRFATESRHAFMAEYARGQADTRLPPGVDTTMFVGPPKEYVQEVCLKQRSPTHREREINWLRTMLIQPAWLTNFEVETVLQAIRLQMIDRYLPPPLHFNSTAEILEPFVNDLPSLAGYSKVLFFVTFHHHWITISGLKHENRWMLTAAVPDPKSSQLPVLFSAIAAILESSPSMVHIQAVETRSPPHLCGWMLLQSLRDYVSLQLFPDTTLLLQRIATMPNSRIKTLLFEEALSTWTRHAPNQELVTFAAQVRIFVLAHMDTWTHDHILHFGGMFPSPTPPKAQASWNVVSQATKSKILQKIRSHVQRPFVCPCVQRLTAYVEIDRRIASDDNIAIFAASIKPSPLQWASHFCQESVIHAPCSHVQTTEVLIQVPKLSADLIPGRVEAIIYQGRVTGTAAQFVISLLDLESGIRIFRHGRNHATLNLDIGEFCSGAFSGWTQAGKVLETMGFPTATKFAIDHDHCVATWYARNFTDGALAAKPEDIFRLRDEAFYYREAPIIFQTDVQFGWYLLFCEPIEIATASPPCPAFSAAGTATGLEKAEGQVIIDTILKIMLLQPKVLVLEEVATLHTHAHFPLILELLNWGNFQVAWQTTLNLDDWLPQSRPRLILVAFRRCSYGLQHFPCQPWRPGPSRSLSLPDSHCLLTDEAITEITAAPLDFETAKLYFDPSKVPGAVPRSKM